MIGFTGRPIGVISIEMDDRNGVHGDFPREVGSPRDAALREIAIQRQSGGNIPGTAGSSAFYLRSPLPSAIPVLVAVPHAGRAYPGSLLERMRHPAFAALRLEDRKIDLLAEEMA